MDVPITKMSSKGQVVIPAEMRKDIEEGEKLLVIKDNGKLIMKKVSTLDKNLAGDLEFAKKTEEAWKNIGAGKGTTVKFDDFIKALKNW